MTIIACLIGETIFGKELDLIYSSFAQLWRGQEKQL